MRLLLLCAWITLCCALGLSPLVYQLVYHDHSARGVPDKPDVQVCEIPPDWQDFYVTTFVNCADVSMKRSA